MNELDSRISWDEFFFEVAKTASKRSPDPHTQVGAVLVKNKKIIGVGYNGQPKNFIKDFNWKTDEKYKYVIHAEMNAIANASNLNDVKDSTLYVTMSPCLNCCKLLSQFEIKEVRYLEEYKDINETTDFAKSSGIIFKKFS